MLVTVDDYRRRAARVLPRFAFDYLEGEAEDGICARANRADLDALTLVPRVLRDTSQCEPSIEVFGARWALPIGVAPTGLNGLFWPKGDSCLAAAADRAGTVFTVSTAASERLEALAAPGALRWFQLYVMERKLAAELVRRAQAAGYQALVLTVDVPVGGLRERDLRNGFAIPFRPTARLVADVARRPGWLLRTALAGPPRFENLRSDAASPSPDSQAALLARAMDRSFAWEDVHWLRRLWQGPLLLKGILHPADAQLALRHGVDGIIVSNHGGRQLDCGPSTITALPAVVAAVQDRIPVFLDGGARRGSHVAKALALGAKAVLVGRPLLYGLASRGAPGCDDVFGILRAELLRTMTLLGTRTAAELADPVLNPASHWPSGPPAPTS